MKEKLNLLERSADKLRDLSELSADKYQFSAVCDGEFNVLTETESKSKLNLLERSADKLQIFYRSFFSVTVSA
jgi:hypothetical protein